MTNKNRFTVKFLSDIPMDFYEQCLKLWIERNNKNDERINK